MKKKIILISNTLQKAGSEKYTYELVNKIDKSIFDVEVITIDDVFRNQLHPHFYYFELKKIGINISTILDPPHDIRIPFLDFFTFSSFFKKGVNYINKRINRYRKNTLYHKKLTNKLNSFDAVILIDALYYYKIKSNLNPNIYFETHLMCHQAQFDEGYRIYKHYEKDRHHNFVYIDPYQLDEVKSQNLKVNNSFYLPLSLDLDSMNYIEGNILPPTALFNIGIFTRINRNKPIHNLIIAFHDLIKLNSKARLKIFGFIQDTDYYQELLRLIERFDLTDFITFEGHSNNMLEDIRDKHISLLWILSIFDFSGYAGKELSLNGIPMILCNIEGNNKIRAIDDETSIPPYFYTPEKLAIYTDYIVSQSKLEELRYKTKALYSSTSNLGINVKNYEKHLLKSINNHNTTRNNV